MTNTADTIAIKVVTFFAASKFSRTVAGRRDARNRAEAYADCYRLLTGSTETTQEIYNRVSKTLDRGQRKG